MLTQNQVADIESTPEGWVAEVRVAGRGWIVTKRPEGESLIRFPYPILCSPDPCELVIELRKRFDYSVQLWSGQLPGGYYLEAIHGYRD